MTDHPPAQSESPALEMREVTVGAMHDQRLSVLEHINWTVRRGDWWAVAGLQGSGKSDLLLMAGGLMPPAGGHYEFLGEPMPIFDEARLAHRLRLGLVFDGGQLFNHLTVWENVALPLRYHRNLTKAQAAAEVAPLLAATELVSWADSTPGAIGRNWQKRVGLARALVLRPEVLLVDNPLAGLDLRHASWWLGFLKQLADGALWATERPTTLVVTTADLRPWKEHARQFAVLRDKRLVVMGDWQQVEAASQELVSEVWSGQLR